MSTNKKLIKSTKGDYYLLKKNNKGKIFKQKVKANDEVYARSAEDGVTKFSIKRDRTKRDVTHRKETPKKHSGNKHKYDRMAKTGTLYYS